MDDLSELDVLVRLMGETPEDVLQVFQACCWAVALQSRKTPRQATEDLFKACIDDSLWREHERNLAVVLRERAAELCDEVAA
jgi:hypothetical protein